jgi:hypothetical protein
MFTACFNDARRFVAEYDRVFHDVFADTAVLVVVDLHKSSRQCLYSREGGFYRHPTHIDLLR